MSARRCPEPDIAQEMLCLVNAAERQSISLRLLGGLAVSQHSPSAKRPTLSRSYSDMDFIVSGEGVSNLEAFFDSMGYVPDKAFNTYNGDRRQLYFDQDNHRQVDIFINRFEMCHALPVAHRIDVDFPTVPLAELFLTKAQIVEMNQKDAVDMITLLLDHPVGYSDQDTIHAGVISDLCARDWGLYTTTWRTLGKLEPFLAQQLTALDSEEMGRVQNRIEDLRLAMLTARKSVGWKFRNLIGTRVRWYTPVEEVRR